VEVTNRALRAGIGACAPGRPFKDIGLAINNVLGKNYSVSSQFCGHGIGTFFHTRPWIFHHSKIASPHSPVSRRIETFISVENDEPGVMKPGHCFTIEVLFKLIVGLPCLTTQHKPTIIQGRNPLGWIFPDEWTASTEVCVDCKLVDMRGNVNTH